MKKKIAKIVALITALVSLCACDGTKVLETENITNKITQKSVIVESEIKLQEDYAAFFNKFKSSFIVPGLFEGIIPQGICYDKASDLFLITAYYEENAYPSMLMTINASTGALVASHPLKGLDGKNYFGHAGGIAVSENTVYITSDSECYTFPSNKLTTTKNGEAIQFKSRFKLNTLGSFACIHNGIFWTGDFVESKKREEVENITTLINGETFYAYCEGYTLIDGLPSVEKINSESNGYVPDYFLAIPEQVQGMAFTETGKIIFSTSYGRKNNSVLYVYNDILLSDKYGVKEIDKHNIDFYVCVDDMLSEKYIAPPMAEGVAEHPNGLYFIFESGAAKYRNGGGKYPVDTAFVTNIE